MASLRYGAAMSYSPAMQRATAEVEDWGPAATLNRVLWQIYPEANLAEGENIVGASAVTSNVIGFLISEIFKTQPCPVQVCRALPFMMPQQGPHTRSSTVLLGVPDK